jgi:hypothetical protein
MLHEITRTQTHNRPRRAWALGLLAAALLLTGCESQADKDKKAADAAYREKLAKAQAIFAERCKTAGVVIKRTVKDVEGIELKKVRPELAYADKRYFDPMFDGAAMAGEVTGDRYVWHFLASEYRNVHSPEQRGQLGPPSTKLGHNQVPPTEGYRYVEFMDETSGKRQRCERPSNPDPKHFEDFMHCKQVQASSTRYALDYEDLVDPADRAYWVAGTKLRVIDKQADQVIAELTRYVIDPGFGVSSTGRWPWSHATIRRDQVCPSNVNVPLHTDSRYFVDTVLIPKQGD